jgi:hypothetical protein
MNYWSYLHGDRDALDLRAGADGLLRLAVAAGTESSSLEMLYVGIFFAWRTRTLMMQTLLEINEGSLLKKR